MPGGQSLDSSFDHRDHSGSRQSWSGQFGAADQFWGNGAERAGEWAARVESSPSYQTALRHRATLLSLTYGPV